MSWTRLNVTSCVHCLSCCSQINNGQEHYFIWQLSLGTSHRLCYLTNTVSSICFKCGEFGPSINWTPTHSKLEQCVALDCLPSRRKIAVKSGCDLSDKIMSCNRRIDVSVWQLQIQTLRYRRILYSDISQNCAWKENNGFSAFLLLLLLLILLRIVIILSFAS